jgi:hypothetical protein
VSKVANDVVFIDESNKEYTPLEYFDYVKAKVRTVNKDDMDSFYNQYLVLLNKYYLTGQLAAMKKIIFHMEIVEKEKEIIDLGINSFVYKDDIDYYIDEVAKNVVKIIELENYEREIPDEIADIIGKTKNIFDKFYVVFTDYTGKVERKVEQTRREKDPILFGTFQEVKNRMISDRFYFLGDWVDEYCDLTLDKMVYEIKKKSDKDVKITISTPTQISELKEQLLHLEEEKQKSRNSFRLNNNTKPLSFFDKVRSVLKR